MKKNLTFLALLFMMFSWVNSFGQADPYANQPGNYIYSTPVGTTQLVDIDGGNGSSGSVPILANSVEWTFNFPDDILDVGTPILPPGFYVSSTLSNGYDVFIRIRNNYDIPAPTPFVPQDFIFTFPVTGVLPNQQGTILSNVRVLPGYSGVVGNNDVNNDNGSSPIIFTPANTTPTANTDVATTPEDSPVTIPVLPNDTFGGDGPSTGTITITDQPNNGSSTVNDGGTPNDPTDDQIVYTPNPNFNGNDTLIYQICDSNNDCDTAMVVITITPVIDPVTIQGTIFNDTNGNTIWEGTETSTTAGTNLYVYLVNDANIIVDSAKVLSNGTYTLDAEQNLNYIIELSTTQYPIGTNTTVTPIANNQLPLGWTNTGENGTNNSGAGDGTPDGALAVQVGTTNVLNQNFGLAFDNCNPIVSGNIDSDGDGVSDVCDLDDDNDGILDTEENACVNDKIAGFPGTFYEVKPSDFGINFTGTPQTGFANLSADLSAKFGYPANSGRVIVNITNANVHPNADAFYNRGDLGVTDWQITGTVKSLTTVEQGQEYFPFQRREIRLYTNQSQITNQSIITPGNWETGVIGNTYYQYNNSSTEYSAATGQLGAIIFNALLDYNDKNFGFYTNDNGLNRWSTFFVRIATECDTDMDGIPNRLDKDSDNDGCLDAIEGAGGIGLGQLDADSTITGNVSASGIPLLVGAGQAMGTSQDSTTVSAECLPIANPDFSTTTEDTPVTIPVVTNNDTFGANGPSTGTITITDQPTNGTATVNDGGTPNDPTDDQIVYTPNPNYNGNDTLIYQICDSNNDCDTALVVITITPTNDVPTANPNTSTTTEDTPVTVPVLPNDTFGGDGPSTGTITITDQPTNGTATVNDGGTPTDPTDDQIVYTPNPNYNGNDTLIYQICDSNNDCDTALVVITITPTNDVPTANPNTSTTTEDTPVTVPVLPNDTFGGDGPSTGTITITDQPTNGTATVNDGGTPTDPTDDQIVYTPNPNFNGNDTLIYQICDSNNDCDTALVVITITPTNDVPTANPNTSTTPEDAPVTIPVLPNDTFGGDGPGTGPITITGQPTNGTVTVNDGGTPNDPTDDQIVYTPNPNYNGNDTLIYQICDSNNDCDTGIVVITVTSVNDTPTANPNTSTTNEDSPVTVPVLPNDTFGGDGPSTGTITITDQPNHGTSTVNDGGTPTDPTDDQIVYTPNPNYNGNDTLIYQICDSNNDCDTAIVVITVTPVNDTPTANPNTSTTPEDSPVTIPVLPNDTFGGDGPSTGTITITDQPNNGTSIVNDGGTPNDPTDDQIVYTPNPNYNGNDTLIYQICDSNGDCDTALVVITITPVNDVPTANTDIVTTPINTPVTVTVLTNDTFGDDGPGTGTITVTDQPTNGTATVNDGGTPSDPTDDQIVYTPNPNFNGSDTLIYQICDSNDDCDTAFVIIKIGDGGPLPVKLISFTGQAEKSNVQLNWLVAQEINVSGYEIQFSKDAVNFNSIGNVTANSSSQYLLNHTTPINGINYYRILTRDSDGKVAYSNIISVKYAKAVVLIAAIAPNPFKDKITVTVELEKASQVKIDMYDITGKKVYQNTFMSNGGINKIMLSNLGNLANGMYTISVTAENNIAKQKILKL